MANQSTRTIKLPILSSREVGKALHITMESKIPGISAPESHYLPLSTVWEIHPDHIVVDEWILRKKEIDYHD